MTQSLPRHCQNEIISTIESASAFWAVSTEHCVEQTGDVSIQLDPGREQRISGQQINHGASDLQHVPKPNILSFVKGATRYGPIGIGDLPHNSRD